MYKCKDCKYFIGEQRSIGRECRNEAKTWRTEYSMYKSPSAKACKMFEPKGGITIEVKTEGDGVKELWDKIGKLVKEDEPAPYALTTVNKKTGLKTLFISENVISEIIEDIMKEKEDAYADFSQYADDHGYDEEYDSFFHRGMGRAAEIIMDTVDEVRSRVEEAHNAAEERKNEEE